MEKRKQIIGYEGLYEISSAGNVKRLENFHKVGDGLRIAREKILKPSFDGKGYFRIGLSKNGKQKCIFVHRIVAKLFIENPENKPQINHKDGNKINNNMENLEWCTSSENHLHSYKELGRKANTPQLGKFGKDNHRSKKINQYNIDGELIKTRDSMMDIYREIGCSQGDISRCCSGKRKTRMGYIRKYSS